MASEAGLKKHGGGMRNKQWPQVMQIRQSKKKMNGVAYVHGRKVDETIDI